MPKTEHAALREDIRKRGVLEPITLLDGKVLDGWHRYTAAKAIDPEYDVPAVDLADRDPADFVISRNLLRRHLTAAQRAVCVLQVRSWKGRGRPSAGGAGPEERTREWTNQELAEEAGCSVSLISAVKREMLKGRGNDIKEGRESIASLRAKGAAERPPTPTEKLRAEVADLREQNAAMAKELTRLREAAEPPDELALQEENETLRARVNILQEKLLQAERARENAAAQRQEMAAKLKAAAMEVE